jgi:hypothetical protein
MALTPLKYAPLRNGEWVPPGRFQYTRRDSDFLDGALPSWLSVPAVTGQATEGATTSFGVLPSARSYVKVTSAARASAEARLVCNYSLDTTLYAGCLWELDGLRFDTDQALIRLSLAGSSQRGMTFEQGPSDSSAFIRWRSGGGFQQCKYLLRTDGRAYFARNIKLFYNFRQGALYAYQDDVCVAAVENVDATGGIIQPAVILAQGAGSTTPVSVSVARARFTLWGNYTG